MSLSATQQLKLERAKMGLREANAKFATAASDQGGANDDRSPLSSDSTSPTRSSGVETGQNVQQKKNLGRMDTRDVTANIAECLPVGVNVNSAQAQEPGAEALSGMLFRHMNVCFDLIPHDL